MDGGGNEAFGKGVAVVRAEDTLLLPGVVTEAPEEINLKGSGGELVALDK